ncbi:PAS domain-containing protein [Halomicrobium katesii]|uniref:PAS domain-containing protein n=1 Tax=Halomicrobium katesii TaxID=437163 RepID=UPI000A46B5EB|nr:PAS domain-containing protein [Halomicrobium katesii]
MSNLTDSELGGYVVSSRDISDRVAAERERDETETRLRELAANTDDVLWMFSGDWSELLFLNPAYESVYGGSVDAIEADTDAFMDCVYPDDVPAVERSMAALSRANRSTWSTGSTRVRTTTAGCGSRRNRSSRTGKSSASSGSPET